MARQSLRFRIQRAVAGVQGNDRPRPQIRVVVWGKPDCSLCDRAHVILDRLSSEYRLDVTTKDITTDPEAFERYRYVIPVVNIEGGRQLEGKITEHWLRVALEEIRKN